MYKKAKKNSFFLPRIFDPWIENCEGFRIQNSTIFIEEEEKCLPSEESRSCWLVETAAAIKKGLSRVTSETTW